MPVDARIPLQTRVAQFDSPLETYGKVAAIKDLIGRGRLQDVAVRQAEQQMADQNVYRSASQEAGGDLQRLRDLLMARGQPMQAMAVDKAINEQSKARREASSADVKLALDRLDLVGRTLGPARSEDEYYQGLLTLRESGVDISMFPRKWSPEVSSSISEKALSTKDRLEQAWKARDFTLKAANQPVTLGPDGQPMVNPVAVGAKSAIAAAGATRIPVDLKVNTFTPASEEAQKEFMKSTRATYDQLKNAPVVLDNIDKAKALIPQAKGFMGPGGESLLEAAKFLNSRLGLSVDTKGVKSAEELRSRVFFQIMENLKKMDAQPSQMQQVMMRDALGKLGTDPNALGAVLDAYGDVVRGKVQMHNREVRGAVDQGVKFPYNPIIELRRSSGGSVIDFGSLPGGR